MILVVLADTHIPRRAKRLPGGLVWHLEEADFVIHAGDLMDASLIDELEEYGGMVLAVRGNLDPPDFRLPEVREIEINGVKIAVIHDAGRREGRARRMRRQFPEARVVVFGHSHVPHLEDDGEQMLLNPGSPTDKRRQPDYTFAVMQIENGAVSAEILNP